MNFYKCLHSTDGTPNRVAVDVSHGVTIGRSQFVRGPLDRAAKPAWKYLGGESDGSLAQYLAELEKYPRNLGQGFDGYLQVPQTAVRASLQF
jgi:hypothetical protein